MKRTRTTLNPKRFPAEVAAFLDFSDIYDSSCSEDAHVFFIDKDQGYFLKEADAGFETRTSDARLLSQPKTDIYRSAISDIRRQGLHDYRESSR